MPRGSLGTAARVPCQASRQPLIALASDPTVSQPLKQSDGQLDLPVGLPPSLPLGPFATIQVAVLDDAAPIGLALTNGVELTVQ